MESISNVCGLVGVLVVLVAYVLLQFQYLHQTSSRFYAANLVGSVLILFSLYYHWNMPSVVIELAWLVISLVGLYRCRRQAYRQQ